MKAQHYPKAQCTAGNGAVTITGFRSQRRQLQRPIEENSFKGLIPTLPPPSLHSTLPSHPPARPGLPEQMDTRSKPMAIHDVTQGGIWGCCLGGKNVKRIWERGEGRTREPLFRWNSCRPGTSIGGRMDIGMPWQRSRWVWAPLGLHFSFILVWIKELYCWAHKKACGSMSCRPVCFGSSQDAQAHASQCQRVFRLSFQLSPSLAFSIATTFANKIQLLFEDVASLD